MNKYRVIGNVSATVLATMLIGAGVVVFPLPIPLGALMILSGVGIMVSINPYARRYVRDLRARNPKLERAVSALKRHLPGFLRRPFDESDPAAAGAED